MSTRLPSGIPEIHLGSWERLSEYVVKTGRTVEKRLGWGQEGLVFSTTAKTALKSYIHPELYANERNVYLRLQEREMNSAGNFAVPMLVGFDDSLRVLEMSVVSPPFILDFAGAYLDRKPPFDDEQWEEWEELKIEQFEDHWPEVRLAMSTFKRHGIYLNDVKPGNVTFPDTGPAPGD